MWRAGCCWWAALSRDLRESITPERPTLPGRGFLGLDGWLAVPLSWERVSRGAVLHPEVQSPHPAVPLAAVRGLAVKTSSVKPVRE